MQIHKAYSIITLKFIHIQVHPIYKAKFIDHYYIACLPILNSYLNCQLCPFQKLDLYSLKVYNKKFNLGNSC